MSTRPEPSRPGPSRSSDNPTHDVISGRRGVVHRRVQPVSWVVLTLIWVMLWGNFSWINVLSGVLLSALVLAVFPMPPVRYGVGLHPWATIVLFTRFFGDMVVASVEVAYKACAPWEHPQGRFVRIPLRGNNDLLCTLTAQMTTLVPGSIVIDLESDDAGRTMLLHLFDAPGSDDVERMRQRVLDQEDRVLKALSARSLRPRGQGGVAAWLPRTDRAGDRPGGRPGGRPGDRPGDRPEEEPVDRHG